VDWGVNKVLDQVKERVVEVGNSVEQFVRDSQERREFHDHYDHNHDGSVDTFHDIPDRVTGDRDYSRIC
jgi:hypothetical protein